MIHRQLNTRSRIRMIVGIVLLTSLWIPVAADTQQADRVVAAHYPPLMIENAPDRPGYAVEVLREAARRADRSIEVQFLPFQRAIYEVLTSQATMMPALFKGKKRDEEILWLAEIHRTTLQFSTLSGSVDTLDAARSLDAIVVERGTTSENLLKGLGFDNVQGSSSPEASANMLASGRATAWLLTEDMMRTTWHKLGMPASLSVGEDVHAIPVFLVASTDLPDEVGRAYRTAIADMASDGTLTRIWQRYAVTPE